MFSLTWLILLLIFSCFSFSRIFSQKISLGWNVTYGTVGKILINPGSVNQLFFRVNTTNLQKSFRMNEYNTEFERGSIHSQLKSIRMRTTGEDPNRNSMAMIRIETAWRWSGWDQQERIRMRTTGEDPNRNNMEMIRMSTIGEDPDSFGLSEGSEDGQLENIQTKSD